MPVFTRRTRFPTTAAALFDWHRRPGALERLMPPWDRSAVVARSGGLEPGSRVELRIRIGPLSRRWVSEHREYTPGRSFRDVQVRGPFARWDHTHTIEPAGEGAATLEDRIVYELPFGPLGRLGESAVRRMLSRAFAYRHRVLADDLAALGPRGADEPRRIGVMHAEGVIGRALVPFLSTAGHWVHALMADGPAGRPTLDVCGASDPLDALVYLGTFDVGRSPARHPDGLHALCRWLASAPRPPRTVVCASVDLGRRSQSARLAECRAFSTGSEAEHQETWQAARLAIDRGVRMVHLRLGLVLTPRGGLLRALLPMFLAGLGGPPRHDDRVWSWVAIDDVLGAIRHAIVDDGLEGSFDVTAPHPVEGREFASVLGRVLGRTARFRAPRPVLRFALGELASEELLSGGRIRPEALLAAGYRFRWPDLEPTLRHLLGRGLAGAGREEAAP